MKTGMSKNVLILLEETMRLTSQFGIPTEFHAFNGLGHGFGLGTGTVAEGWINGAVAFWEEQTETN